MVWKMVCDVAELLEEKIADIISEADFAHYDIIRWIIMYISIHKEWIEG